MLAEMVKHNTGIVCMNIGSCYLLHSRVFDLQISSVVKLSTSLANACFKSYCRTSSDENKSFIKRVYINILPSICVILLSIPFFVFRACLGDILSLVFALTMTLDKIKDIYSEPFHNSLFIVFKLLLIALYALCILFANLLRSCLLANLALSIEIGLVIVCVIKQIFLKKVEHKDVPKEGHNHGDGLQGIGCGCNKIENREAMLAQNKESLLQSKEVLSSSIEYINKAFMEFSEISTLSFNSIKNIVLLNKSMLLDHDVEGTLHVADVEMGSLVQSIQVPYEDACFRLNKSLECIESKLKADNLFGSLMSVDEDDECANAIINAKDVVNSIVNGGIQVMNIISRLKRLISVVEVNEAGSESVLPVEEANQKDDVESIDVTTCSLEDLTKKTGDMLSAITKEMLVFSCGIGACKREVTKLLADTSYAQCSGINVQDFVDCIRKKIKDMVGPSNAKHSTVNRHLTECFNAIESCLGPVVSSTLYTQVENAEKLVNEFLDHLKEVSSKLSKMHAEVAELVMED